VRLEADHDIAEASAGSLVHDLLALRATPISAEPNGDVMVTVRAPEAFSSACSAKR
jgi:hypothetical protein